MKTIAMYLPQFHRVPENNEWWGEGFTEWITVKKATQLFEGHNQPREPLDDNYYDLMDKRTMQWQAKLALQHNIHGFCFYHYWFKDGKRILEKPAENLLQWKDINMRFCFCWANEAWVRTWSNVKSGNTWSNKFEKESVLSDNGILLDQKYGREKDWKDHFNYLLPFFIDERYIKINGKPLFNIYQPLQISCLDDMIKKWNEWAVEAGLNGLYIIASNPGSSRWENVDAYLTHEPRNSIFMHGSRLLYNNSISSEWKKLFFYDETWKAILNTEYSDNDKIYVGGFVDYDDTPRHSVKGSCFYGMTIDKFEEYFEKLVVKNIKMRNEFVFLNAWNEWGEGMYIEPDKRNGYGIIMAIKRVMDKYEDNQLNGVDYKIEPYKDDEYISSINVNVQKKQVSESLLLKYKEYYDMMNRWLYLRDEKKSIKDFFVYYGYFKIAIYGAGDLGNHLYSELRCSEISVDYFIDKRAGILKSEAVIKSPKDELPPVDVIVVTPTLEYNNIKKELEKIIQCPIVSLKEVVFET